MGEEHQITERVYDAKGNMQKADSLIRDYIPFIRKEAAKFMSRLCTEQDDEFSIAMIAFHEAIQGYSKERGAFLSYASLLIKNRLIDFIRKESRHTGKLSLDEPCGQDETPMHEYLADERNPFEESANLDAAKQEIAELSKVMQEFKISLTDVADNSPKQQRTLEICQNVVRYAINHPSVLEELLHTKKLPMTELVKSHGAKRKTLERHRRYILAMLLIQTNGYEIIRGHLKHVLNIKGEVSV